MDTHLDKNSITSFLIDDRYRLYRHLLLQLVLLVISIGNFFDAPDRLHLSLNRFYGWLGYFLFLDVLVYFNAYVLFPFFLAKNKVLLYILSVIAFVCGMSLILIFLQENFYDIGVTHHEPSVVAIVLSITSSLLAIFLFIGGVAALLLLRQWMRNNRHIGELKTATYQSELKYLKSQINPHFLFNMLNNANILIEDDPEMATDILQNLDCLLQYQLGESLQENVSLGADIGFLRNYLELEKTRRDNFEYRITTEGDVENLQVASLLFIPFVENAVKHNFDSDNLSYVHLSFTWRDHTLEFVCENSLPQKETKKEGVGGLGLANIQRRLELLYKDKYTLKQVKTDTVYRVNLNIEL